jgi:hypothetical protein
MNIKEWVRSTTTSERAELLEELGTKVNYIYQLAGGFRRASPGLAQELERLSEKYTPGNVIHKHEVRPDIWDPPSESEAA